MSWDKIDDIIENNVIPEIHLTNKVTYKKIEKILNNYMKLGGLCTTADILNELSKYSKGKNNIKLLMGKIIIEPLMILGSTIGFCYSAYKREQYKKINKLSKIFFKALSDNNEEIINNVLEAIGNDLSYEYLMYFFNKPKNINTDKTILETAILKNNIETLQFFTNKLGELNNSYSRIFYMNEIKRANNFLNNFQESINEITDVQNIGYNLL